VVEAGFSQPENAAAINKITERASAFVDSDRDFMVAGG
jgi:hypothetical protein